MIGRIGFPELIIVMVLLAIIGGIIYAVVSLVRHYSSTSKRLENIEKNWMSWLIKKMISTNSYYL